MDFDWDVQPFDGVYVYIAMSDNLQEWAFYHDRLHLLKIGYSINPEKRLEYLNGNGLRNNKPIRPCLNFTDWRIIGKWPLPNYRRAKGVEQRLKDVFAQTFKLFDRKEIVEDYKIDNGETEVYQVQLIYLPILPRFFRIHNLDESTVRQSVYITEAIVEEIQRWRSRFLVPSDEELREQQSMPIAENDYKEIIEQMQEDMEADARVRDGGWPYEDD